MNDAPKVLAIVPAEPGWRVVHSMQDEQGKDILDVGERVIAWVIEHHHEADGHEWTLTTGITADGDAGSDVWGYLAPDGKIEGSGLGVFESLEDARKFHAES